MKQGMQESYEKGVANFSELNTQPTCTPVYASLNTSRCATQNSGPSEMQSGR
jgi:hypothetical protein